MPTTKPGYVWSGAEWIGIGQEAAVSPIKYQSTQPTSPAVGDVWVDSSTDIAPAYQNTTRWQYTATGGETSLSGTGLTYNVGYEQVYLNGVLLVRNQDYTATDGLSITGLTALVSGDAVEVITANTFSVADVYTQAQSNANYRPITTVNGFGIYTGGAVLVSMATYITINITSTGRPLLINASIRYVNANSGANREVQFRVQNDGTTVLDPGLYTSPILSSGSIFSASASCIITPAAGARSITLQVGCTSASSCTLPHATLTVAEL